MNILYFQPGLSIKYAQNNELATITMSTSIFVLGMNHKTAALQLREKVYFSEELWGAYLQDLLSRGLAEEAVLISTCNRSELYCATDDIASVREWFCAQTTLSFNELDPVLYVYRDEAAIEHIMTVACGLDSMVLGETQILGQLKQAFSESCAAGAVNTLFYRLFQRVFAIAKEVRTATAIGACPVSVASAAVHFIKQQVGVQQKILFNDANVVLVGAGETASLLLRYLKSQLNQRITILNRNIDKAEALAEDFFAQSNTLDHLEVALEAADIVFSATGSPTPLLTKEMVLRAVQRRENKPLIFFDLAVPRDIDPEVATVAGAYLYCIDDLKIMIEQHRQGREHAADKAREMIRKESIDFFAQSESHDKVTHTIRAYRDQFNVICEGELAKARHQLRQGVDPELVLSRFAHAFMKKLLHVPSVQLRQAGAEGRFELVQFAKQLFAISDPETEAL